MRKRIVSRFSFLAMLLLVLQLFLPLASTYAAGGSILPPSNLAAQMITPDDVKLTWSSVYGATGYNVYEIKEGEMVLLGKATTTSYTRNDLAEGTYSYVVSTLSAEGESGPCAPVSVTVVYPEMAAPFTLTKTIQNGNDIVLSWGASQYAQSYNVYQIMEDGQKNLLSSTTARTYTISRAAEGQYTYSVSAVNPLYGESALATPVQVDLVHPVMTAPGNFTYTVSNGSDVTFKWNAVSYATSYKLYQIVDGQRVLKNTATTTTVKLTNVPAGDYVYEIHSFSDRFGESAEGSQLPVTVSEVTMTAPANFAYKLQNTNDIVLTWASVPNATSYKVYQIVDGEEVLKSTVTGTTVTYPKMPGGDYTFAVRSYSDRFGESAESSQISLTVDSVTVPAPGNFAYQIKNGNDIVLTWASVPNATNYKVYQVVNGQETLKSTVTTLTATYANMPAGDYVYVVRTYSDRFGESTESSRVSFTLEPVTMEAPANFSYVINNGNDIVLSWGSAAYATNYKVYQIVNGQKVLKSTITGTSVSYTNMPAGNYSYEVHSYSTRFGESPEGAQLSLSLVHPVMQPPANAVHTIKNATDFTLSWDAAQYATNYKVYQVINGQKTLKSTVSTTSVTFTGMAPGDYSYVITSYSSRFGESPAGTEHNLTLNGQTMLPPTNLTHSIANGNDITLRWTAAQYATSYKIYQVVDGEKVLKNTVTGTSVTFTNLPAGDYNYVIHSVSTLLGESPDGAEVTIALVHPVMTAPANLSSKIQNGNDVVLSWVTVPYANSYRVYEVIDGQKVLKSTVTALSATITNVPAGEHTYVVHSVSLRFGESVEGSQVVVTVQEHTMEAPGNLTNTFSNGNDITLRWNAVTFATSYNVYQIIDGQAVLKKTVTTSSAAFANMPEGDYKFEVRSVSTKFGESPEGSQIDVTVVFPTMQAPGNFTQSITNGNDITLRWNAAAYATAYKIYQIIDGQPVLKRTVTSTSTAFTNMPEGDYEFEVRSFSDRFGESPMSSKVSFNLTWPVVQPPVLTGTVFNANNMTLTWTAVTWANEYRVYKVTGDTRQLIYKGTAKTYQVYNLTEDTHSFEVTAYNVRFGESAASNRVTETIVYPEMQPPVATVRVLSETSARISWNFVTYANGYNVYEIIDGQPVLLVQNLNNLSYTVSNLSYADHEYIVTSYSNSFGESAPSNRVIAKLIVDTEAPVTTVQATEEWTKDNLIVTLTPTDSGVGVAATYYSMNDGAFIEGRGFFLEAEGIYKLSFYSVDKVGNTETTKTIYIKIDKTAPVTKIGEIPDWFGQTAALQLIATDEKSGVAKTFYSVDGSAYVEGTTVTVGQDGVHKISYYSVDAAGNTEAAKTVEVKLDKSAPVTTANAPADWSKDDVTVSLTATDEQSGVAKTFYSVDGSAYVEGTTVTVGQEGVHHVAYYSVDAAGNTEAAKTVEVKIDKSAPVSTANATDGWSKEDVTVSLTATDEQSGVAKTFYSVDGSEYVEGTTLTISQEGVHKVSYYSVDAAGNIEAAKTVEVKIDKSAPVTTANAIDGWSKNDVTVSLTATDEQSGVAKTYYSVDGSEYVEGTTVTVEQEGVHKVSYYSVDAAGNIEAAKTVEVKIDKSAPVITMNLDEEYKMGTSVKLSYSASDDVSGIAAERMVVTGPSGTETVLANGDAFTLNKPGVYKVTVTATNAAGLTTTVEKQFVVYIGATVEVTPNVIKGSNGVFTLRVQLDGAFKGKGFDLNTATLNGVKALASNNGYYNQAQQGQFKFERSSFNWNGSEVTLEFRCYVDGYLVVATTTVKLQK